ncbi:response regulator transcription factor [Paenibacillus aceris]|uniref:Two-component system response regulator YesN n=1 Tax=Paenibacillus aceris TaxID=869555 RepID=A0ABS4HSD6_9BACL|nr:response regulator transcription factor [Paenibacillus aceris]MBP1961543.1 two-component system response regulator YesN [Paenibacillus aceris]NHW37680.1 response regulator transcription factor [Paenibacillus aceris]
MYKVLLVDDERMILEGISSIVDWKSVDTELIGTARNGIEAYAFVCEHEPDIVISDIRMPGMDGLQLVAKVKESHPQTRFIMLSGFDEFEYAQIAMQHGVKHYLLKPCNENSILKALSEIAAEYKQEESKEGFIKSMKANLQKVLPHVKEQFLKEFVTNKSYGSRDWEYYQELFGLHVSGRKVRLLLFRLEDKFEYEHLFAVKNIAEDILDEPLLSSTIAEHILVLIEDQADMKRLQEQIEEIRRIFMLYYKIDTTAALSEPGEIEEARRLYLQAIDCLSHRFYLGEGGLITMRDILDSAQPSKADFVYDDDRILFPIRAGNWEEAEASIEAFQDLLVNSRLDIQTTKSYVIQSFISMTRLYAEPQMHQYMGLIGQISQMETLQASIQMLKQTASEITHVIFEQNRNKHSQVIQKVIDIVNAELANAELSLNWVAHKMLYMNPDYLGKLFKKETGERFSNYVVTVRIKKAMELIKSNDDVKMFELAEQLGFGDNPQYFSQVFKKIAGCAPSEYKKQTM